MAEIFLPITSLLIFSPRSSNRLNFILKTLLTEELGLEYVFTSDIFEFRSSEVAKLNYSAENAENCINIIPHKVLFEHGIKNYPLEVINNPQFFKIFFKNNSGDIPFDIFGASFWLLTRYEEYLPHKTDRFKRFHYGASLAYQFGFIEIPLINFWLQELKKILNKYFPELVFKERKYNFISTIDIDAAYKYKFKGFVRTIAGIIAEKSIRKTISRLKIIFNKAKDPYDCYDFLIALHKKQNIKPIFFLLLGDYGLNDKNHPSSDLNFQKLIKHLADYSAVGIHPSYGSSGDLHQLRVEIARLSNIVHRNIHISRQHFSMLQFPITYRQLLQAGIANDYSMGFTNHNGFRASYCMPFKWYDLENETFTSLNIHPFCISENTLMTDSNKSGKVLKSFQDQ